MFSALGKTNLHCVKSVQIQSYFWSVFSRIRTEYGKIFVSLRILSKCRANAGKYGLEITPYLDTFRAVLLLQDCSSRSGLISLSLGETFIVFTSYWLLSVWPFAFAFANWRMIEITNRFEINFAKCMHSPYSNNLKNILIIIERRN